jgi:hypothetical protein
MPDHERCAGCGGEGHHRDGPMLLVYCKRCWWRAPNWEQWDRVMRAARERDELLDKILRGLRSEDDSVQLRAIIAEVEAMKGAPR